MAPNNASTNPPRLEIIDRDGWRKVFALEKPLLFIGSDARNDIVLESRRGGGVAPRHLQLVSAAVGAPAAASNNAHGSGSGPAPAYRVINLGDRDVVVGEAGGRSLAPRSAMNIVDGDTLRLGDFGLVFHLDAAATPLAAPGMQRPVVASPPVSTRLSATESTRAEGATEVVGVGEPSLHIGLQLLLPRSRLDPDRPLEGLITVSNLGDEPGVQFRLEVEGLHPDCYEIGPGPILFPHVEKAVHFRLHHPRGPAMAAGQHQIQIRASAPDAYPGESASVSCEIEILPYFRHVLALAEVG
ncbi:MAG: FHA domain-containing protein [Anaerolineae bacterium]